MTHLVMDEQPARSRRGALIAVALGVLALGAAGFWAWRARQVEPQQPAPTLSDIPATPPEVAPVPEQRSIPAVARVETVAVSDTTLLPTATVSLESTGPSPATLLAEAEAARADGRLQAAREKALAVLAAPGSEANRTAAETLAGAVGMELLLTPRPMPEKQDYTVQPGDSLDRIARRNGTTVELLQKANQLRSSVIRPGDRLRVFTGDWSVRVSKSRNDLLLLLNDQFFKRYRVGTGEYAKTPVGEFKIVDRIAQPTWWHPDGRTIPFGDPENLLGTHWLALDVKGYGLHGTWEPETVGRQSSMGCVRLVNEDVEELFTILTIGTPVIIEE
ncbi:MAG TPA: L,D-transpeptidase family protein [Kiritimatiellia bacterium]|nr:L,D-transpeptidase family protein [Kiritimatiellia bacterium]